MLAGFRPSDMRCASASLRILGSIVNVSLMTDGAALSGALACAPDVVMSNPHRKATVKSQTTEVNIRKRFVQPFETSGVNLPLPRVLLDCQTRSSRNIKYGDD